MRLTKKFWIGSLIAASMMLAAVSIGQPFPTLKGNNTRTGVNADPLNSSPGRGFLTWFRPNANDAVTGTIVRNNTAEAPNVGFTAGFAPAPLNNSASFYYDQPSFGNVASDRATGGFANYPFDIPPFDGRTPFYRYSSTVATPSLDDPRVGSTQQFTWVMDPLQAPVSQGGTGANFARNYALYVWLPAGSTNPGGGRIFPQRNFVYEITYGTGQTYIEVIDTYASGPGWVRLGNAGSDSNRMFQYNGTNPITIRLHNTVPIDPNTNRPSDDIGTTLVYADAAMAVPQVGTMNATPTIGALTTAVPGVFEGRAIAAVNQLSIGEREGQTVTISQGEVKSYSYANGAVDTATTGTRWTFRPADQNFTVTMDNLVATNSGFTSNPVGPGSASALGTDYLTAPIVTPGPATAGVTYAPTLEEGQYQIQMYLSPDTPPQLFGQAVEVLVHEGAGNTTTVIVNLNRGPGWYPIGTTRYENTEADPLSFEVTNVGGAADVGKLAYADAVRFVGAFDVEVNSTPTSARVWINTAPEPNPPVLQERDVVIVCADDGRIYCLDANGNADGTTNVYWAYPSIADPTNPAWTDPNILDTNYPLGNPNRNVDGDNGVTIAEMPIGFGRSSPVIQRVGGVDYVMVAARNGRVYCLNTAGRGDFDFATQRPGTVRRQWSYPNDYPRPRQAGSLGSFSNASVAYAEVGGTPRLYVPTESGHMLALNPVGNVATRTTNVLWDYPGRTQQIAPITTTPAIFNGRIYFGTTLDSTGVGRFYSVDAGSGSLATDQIFSGPTVGDPTGPETRAFFGGPATVEAAFIGGVGAVDTVYVSNNNLNIYALDAADINNVIWRTNELNTTVTGPLTFTQMSVFDQTGIPGLYPTVVVPGSNGQWSGLFARGGVAGNGITNSFGGKFNWGKISQGQIVAGTSVGNPPTAGSPGFLYGGDTNGNLFAFSNTNTIGGQGTPPIQDIIEPDNPDGLPWRNAKIKILPTKAFYENLRNDPSPTNYNAVNSLVNPVNEAFEWGETVYLAVYDFPYNDTLSGNVAAAPALVNIQISTEGATTRQFSVVARQFTAPPAPPAQRDGYAVLAFAIQGSGPNSLPPGQGRVSFSVTPARDSSTGQSPQVAQNPSSYLDFRVANPIGIAVGPTLNEQIGVTPVTNDPGALVNGSPNLPSTPTNNETLLTTFFGIIGHASTGSSVVQVYDRSLMTYLRGPGRGLDQVRALRPELEWYGDSTQIRKRIPQGIFGILFEDLPDDRPNTSLDYPNIRAENVRVTKDPNGQTENPGYSGVFLRPPTNGSGGFLNEDTDNPDDRRLIATPFLFEVDVPRFQPANFGTAWTSSTGANINTGYSGRVSVFVDSNNDGQLNTISGRLEANRGFWLNGAVPIDEAVEVRTPIVDLGSLPGGAGYTPLVPGIGPVFSPWGPTTEFTSMFKPFVVENPGNVNLLNLRVAKATRSNVGRLSWGIFSSSVDELAWVDAGVGLWSDIDQVFARTPQVLLQKPRVGDRSSSVLQTNPVIRQNGNLDTPGGRFLAAPFSDNPRVAVTLPIGFPVGTYSQVMRVIEDTINSNNGGLITDNEALSIDGGNALEAFSDPTFSLTFKARETRLTNDNTRLTAPMIDESAVLGTAGAGFIHQNLQPTAARASNGDLGDLLVAWTSSRASAVEAQPTNASRNDQFRLYLAGLNNNNLTPPAHRNLTTDGSNGVVDLLGFTNSSGSRWFNAAPGSANGYPGPAYLYPTVAGETIVGGTEKYGAPALPSKGQVNTVAGVISNPVQFANFDMPFVGEAQKQTPSGRVSESRLFITRVTMPANGTPDIRPNPIAMPFDLYSQKGRPSAVRLGDLTATPTPEDLTFIAYSALSAGNSRAYWTSYDDLAQGNATQGWSAPQPINFGEGFESVTSPSVTVRPYTGWLNQDTDPNNNIAAVFDISFTGKLRGRRNTEVFQGRLPTFDPSNPINFPAVSNEVLTPDSETGLFRARGVDWDVTQLVDLRLETSPGVYAAIAPVASMRLDKTTGLMVFDTTLGGKAYLDPRMGTVRLSTGLPLSTQRLVLSYTPKFMRVSTGTTAGYSGVSQFNDNRFDGVRIGDPLFPNITKYWARPNGSGIVSGDHPRLSRFFLTYNRAAAGAGQAARPFMKTLRLGVQLPHQLHTDQNGNITGLNVTAATGTLNGFFQVDPVRGRIYFSPEDEDRQVRITYSAVDQSTGGAIPGLTYGAVGQPDVFVSLIPETDETPVPIEQAVNESNMFAFPDPFDAASIPRPNLVWMFWSSTRGGSPDLYFQTVAPRFAPQPSGN